MITENEFTRRLSALPDEKLNLLIDLINIASRLQVAKCSENEILNALGQTLVTSVKQSPLRIDVIGDGDFRERDNKKVA